MAARLSIGLLLTDKTTPMEKNIIKHLNWYYYGIMALTVCVAAVAYFLVVKQLISPIDPLSRIGKIAQYIIIFDVLLTLPFGLWKHKKNCTKIAKIEDEEARLKAYQQSAMWRIILVSNTMIWAFAAYYLMGAYMSMLWVAAISAIGWYFTKPTEKKLYFELHPQEEQY